MASVTARIQQIKQPLGGYIKPSEFKETIFDDGKTLEEENLHPTIIGMAVDYLTRFMCNQQSGMKQEDNANTSFIISLHGYMVRIKLLGDAYYRKDVRDKVDTTFLLKQVQGLDDKSIVAACKLVTYDVWYRNPMAAITSKGAGETMPDNKTIENIRIMVERGLTFWKQYGPVVKDGFTFEKDGYTAVVDTGDGDFLTADTMWDFKVSKSKPTNKHTLQLLMYWIMGKHSKKPEFKNITKLGIFNPRLNTVYCFDIANVSQEIIQEIEKEVICYK